MTAAQTTPASASGQPLLSICIPTYNRGPFLSELLGSIVRAAEALPDRLRWCQVEVVISDNASSDDTVERVDAFRDRLNIIYARQPENIGPDLNYLAVIDAAHGRYCWLMGSDDVIEPTGLSHVLRAAAEWDVAGFSVNYDKRSFTLDTHTAVRPPVRYKHDIVVSGWEEIYRNFVGHFGFLSAHIVRRDLWQAVAATGEPLAFINGYVHVLMLGRVVEQFPRWGYIHAICVGWRGRNDSFVSGDHVDRMMIDVNGYGDITRHLFGDGPVTAEVMNNIAGTHILTHYRVAKVFYHSGASLRRARQTLAREYWRYPAFWTKLLPWMIIPAPLLHGLWIAYQRGRQRVDPRFKIHPQARRR